MWSGERIGERLEKSFLEVRFFLALRRFLLGGCLRETLGWFWWCLDAVIRRGWGFWWWRKKVGVRLRERDSEEGICIGAVSYM